MARVLSKLGFCSRNEAWQLAREGRIKINSRPIRDGEHPVNLEKDSLTVDDKIIGKSENIYLMLNKPRGLVVSSQDEQGRETVYKCFEKASLPRIIAVGRLDKASEGLLLFTNDTAWAAAVSDPLTHCDKTYHVQVKGRPDAEFINRLRSTGIQDGNDILKVKAIQILRHGDQNTWFEIILDEGKNRHIRRIFDSSRHEVLRLIRTRIGSLALGELPKGQFRHLSSQEKGRVLKT